MIGGFYLKLFMYAVNGLTGNTNSGKLGFLFKIKIWMCQIKYKQQRLLQKLYIYFKMGLEKKLPCEEERERKGLLPASILSLIHYM